MKTSYRAARFSLALLDFLTWLALVAAILTAAWMFQTDQKGLAFAVGGCAILFAMFEFALTQFARAQIDTADNTANILEILRKNAERTEPPIGNQKVTARHETRREPSLSKY